MPDTTELERTKGAALAWSDELGLPGTATIESATALERERCVKIAEKFARKWWIIHCATNEHMDTTRKAHDDFCALQAEIRKT